MSSTLDVENQQDRKEPTLSSPAKSELRGDTINVDISKDDGAGPSSRAEIIYKLANASETEEPENVKKYRDFDPKVCHDLFIVNRDYSISVAEDIGGDSMLQEICSGVENTRYIRLNTSDMGENVFPLSPDNYEKLLERFDGRLDKLSEPHFELHWNREVRFCTLKLPKVNKTWSNISFVFLSTKNCPLGLTTGLTREAFRQICWIQGLNDPLYFILSLFQCLEKEVTNDIIENQSTLETVEQVLTRPLQDQEINQEDSLKSLNMKLINLIVSTSVVRSQLKYISSQLDYVGKTADVSDGVSLRKDCGDRLLDVEILEKRINTNITVISNILAQKEIDWNHKMNRSQQVIAILTMLFLPATFIAILFTMPLFNWDPQPDESVLKSRFWIYCAFSVSITVGLFILYFIWGGVKNKWVKNEQNGENGHWITQDEERGNMRKAKQS